MAQTTFTEGVKPGGLTTGTELRILLCYVLDNINASVTRQQLEEALLEEELVNYFVLAEGISLLIEQQLVTEQDASLMITDKGRTVGRTLADDVPRTVREAAVRAVIRTQQYAAKLAAHQSEIIKTENGRIVNCALEENGRPFFKMELSMPDELSAEAVKQKFIDNGDGIYTLLLAALTDDPALAQKALDKVKQYKKNKQ